MITWNDPSLARPARSMTRRRHTVHTTTSIPTAPLDSSEDEDEYGYERGLTYDAPPLPPSPVADDPMSPERRARKQRLRPASRRGGALHSDLLKSAVLATLESYESEGEERGGTTNSINTPGPRPRRRSTMMEDNNNMPMDDNSRSRKRARQNNLEIAAPMSPLDDCFLGAMDVCTISPRRQSSPIPTATATTTPRRHVARRTSKELAFGIVPSPRTNSAINGDHCASMAD